MSSSSGRREAVLSAALAFLPLLLDWLYKAVLRPRPFWAFYYDPETIYLYDGLRLLRGQTPANVDNPATIVQLLSAAILAPLPRSPLVIDQFRSVAYLVALAINAAGIYLLMRTVLRDSPPLIRIAAVWAFLAFPSVLEYNTVWSPDTLYLGVGSVGVAAAWLYFRSPSTRFAAIFGVAIGFCVALKFTFLTWIVAMVTALALTMMWRHLLVALLGCAGGFMATTAPSMSRYPDMFRLVTRMFFHAGRYGHEAAPTVVKPTEIVSDVVRFATAFWPWHVWAAMVAAAAVAVAVRRRNERTTVAATVFALLCLLLPYAAAARHVSPRYIIPAALASILLVGIAGARLSMSRPWQLTPIAVASVILALTWRADLQTHDTRNVNSLRLNAAVRYVIGTQKLPNAVIVYGWRFPTPSYALRAMVPDADFIAPIERRFPREGDYDPFLQRLRLPAAQRSWDFFIIPPQDLKGSPAAGARLIARAGDFLIMRHR